MKRPRGSLTRNQYAILLVIWDDGAIGLTVAEIWRAIGGEGNVARTTVLNQVDRLVKRGWLKRKRHDAAFRHTVPLSKHEVDQQLAAGFLDDFFGSHPLQAFKSMLQAGACDEEELEELRRMVDDALADSKDSGGEL